MMNIFRMKTGIRLAFLFLCVSVASTMNAQIEEYEADYEAEYEKRIRKSRINGVYIPKDFEDAFIELKRLSHPDDLKKFSNQPEGDVTRKLHFGLGRWMTVNWGFYDGSRFSHFMKEQGVTFPDDMAQLVMRLFHRHLNEAPLQKQELIDEYIEKRAKERQKILDEAETIEKRKRPREK